MLKILLLTCALACALFAQPAAPNASMVRFDVNNGQVRRPLHRFLSVRLRQLDEKQSHSGRPVALGPFHRTRERNREVLHEILEEAAKPDPKRDAVTRQIGDFYAACMDEKAIDARGLAPLQPELNRIRELSTRRSSPGRSPACTASASRPVRLQLRPGLQGLHLRHRAARPGRPRAAGSRLLPEGRPEIRRDRQKYVAHVQRMLELAGRSPEQAKADAADGHAPRNRAGQGLARPRLAPRSGEDLPQDDEGGAGCALAPTFHWDAVFHRCRRAPVPGDRRVVAGFLQGASTRRFRRPAWTIGRPTSPGTCCTRKRALLPTAFVKENFDFYGKTLTGAKEMRPRWKRCVDFTDQQLGEALGQKLRREDLRRRRQGSAR